MLVLERLENQNLFKLVKAKKGKFLSEAEHTPRTTSLSDGCPFLEQSAEMKVGGETQKTTVKIQKIQDWIL